MPPPGEEEGPPASGICRFGIPSADGVQYSLPRTEHQKPGLAKSSINHHRGIEAFESGLRTIPFSTFVSGSLGDCPDLHGEWQFDTNGRAKPQTVESGSRFGGDMAGSFCSTS